MAWAFSDHLAGFGLGVRLSAVRSSQPVRSGRRGVLQEGGRGRQSVVLSAGSPEYQSDAERGSQAAEIRTGFEGGGHVAVRADLSLLPVVVSRPRTDSGDITNVRTTPRPDLV